MYTLWSSCKPPVNLFDLFLYIKFTGLQVLQVNIYIALQITHIWYSGCSIGKKP